LKKQLTSDVRSTLREAKIAYNGITKTSDGVTLNISKQEDMSKAKVELSKLLQPVQGGLLTGGAQLNLFELKDTGTGYAFSFSQKGFDAKVTSSLQQLLNIMGNRLNAVGVSETSIQQQGADRIVIQIPGENDPERILKKIGGTGRLTFQLLCDEQPGGGTANVPPDCTAYPLKEDVKRLVDQKLNAGNKTEPTADELKKLPQM
jgi:preprotein translocase subunit SecD